MGLDMFLTKKTYIWSDWNNGGKRDLFQLQIPEKYNHIKPERINEISEEVAYWRKSNQIHSWFVENVQNGVDDCGEYYVSKEKLQELVDLCEKVISKVEYKEGEILTRTTWSGGKTTHTYEKGKIVSNVEEIQQLLPSKGGFFFGSTEYDEYYIADLEQTVKQLKPLLQEEGSFYYSSSW